MTAPPPPKNGCVGHDGEGAVATQHENADGLTTPISIDPTGLTENMVIPDGYPNVFVKTVPGVTIKRTASGFMIIVK